jgi:hypothetical protein
MELINHKRDISSHHMNTKSKKQSRGNQLLPEYWCDRKAKENCDVSRINTLDRQYILEKRQRSRKIGSERTSDLAIRK